jgi:hypothetical protein
MAALMAQLAGAVAAVAGIMLFTPGRPEPDAGQGRRRQA